MRLWPPSPVQPPSTPVVSPSPSAAQKHSPSLPSSLWGAAAVTSPATWAVPATCWDQHHFRWHQLAWVRNWFTLIIYPVSFPLQEKSEKPLHSHPAADADSRGDVQDMLNWTRADCTEPRSSAQLHHLNTAMSQNDILKPLCQPRSCLLSSNAVQVCVCSISGNYLKSGLPSQKSLT